MSRASVLEILDELRVIPVVEIADVATAVPLAHALTAAGLSAMEVTLRTPAAIDAISVIVAECPDFVVGAGTLLTSNDVERAVAAGARFLVSPGRTAALSSAAAAANLPFIPGAVTASEVLSAVDAGHDRVKFFPAEASGGTAALTALIAPLRASGVRFMPTGGIRRDTLHEYLAIPEVFAVGGTWIAARDVLLAGRFAEVTERAASALRVVGAAR